jgi:hypothetical protein
MAAKLLGLGVAGPPGDAVGKEEGAELGLGVELELELELGLELGVGMGLTLDVGRAADCWVKCAGPIMKAQTPAPPSIRPTSSATIVDSHAILFLIDRSRSGKRTRRPDGYDALGRASP